MKKSHLLGVICIFSLIYCQSNVVNASVIYTYTGNNYTDIFGSVSTYDTTMNIQGSLELNSLLASNLINSIVTPLSFNFTDGVNTFTDANSGTAFFSFTTDSLSNITSWAIDLDIPYPSPTVVGDLKPFLSSYSGFDSVQTLTCVTVTDGVCALGTSFSWAQNMITPGVWTVVPVPAAVWLFGSGLIGLVGVARRKTHS